VVTVKPETLWCGRCEPRSRWYPGDGLWQAKRSVFGREKLVEAACGAGIDLGWEEVAWVMRIAGFAA